MMSNVAFAENSFSFKNPFSRCALLDVKKLW